MVPPFATAAGIFADFIAMTAAGHEPQRDATANTFWTFTAVKYFLNIFQHGPPMSNPRL